MAKDIERAIISTLVYFNLFNYPLTLFEVQKWLLGVNSKISDIANELDLFQEKGIIGVKDGFYFLNGRGEIVQRRLGRYLLAQKKFKKALWIAKIFRWIPFIKVIAVCNDLAYSNAPKESDIDLAIISSRKRIWLTRFFTVFLLEILGLRPTPLKTENKNPPSAEPCSRLRRRLYSENKICLSFFITEDNLNLKNLMINGQDIHFVYWLAQFVSIYNRNQVWQKFIQENQWLREYLPNWRPYQTTLQRQIKPLPKLISSFLNYSGKLVTNLDEKFYRWLQLKIMPKRLKEMASKGTQIAQSLASGETLSECPPRSTRGRVEAGAHPNKDTGVVINDRILKFHDKDNRQEIQRKFQNKLNQLSSQKTDIDSDSQTQNP